ncbi:MAG: hypothetical protein NVSMB5_15000 [Candidatus Velthaea sp.]
MTDRNERWLRTLAVVRAAGILEPVWDPRARNGFIYRGTGSALDDQWLAEDLEELAIEDYVERVFVDRLSVCPHCESHAINVREVCMTCSSSKLEEVTALLHFRCGFVGPVSAFGAEAQGLRCPKCRKILQDLGTDHDSPGTYFICGSCNASFQFPEIGARCLSCGSRFVGVDMDRMRQRDVFAYRVTLRGECALEDGRLHKIGAHD